MAEYLGPHRQSMGIFQVLGESYTRVMQTRGGPVEDVQDCLVSTLSAIANFAPSIHECFQMLHFIYNPIHSRIEGSVEQLQVRASWQYEDGGALWGI